MDRRGTDKHKVGLEEIRQNVRGGGGRGGREGKVARKGVVEV
jgi:hypothetical protein